MTWLHLTDRKTGAAQIVASLDGIKAARFEIIELDREPGEFEEFDGKGLVVNAKRRADTLTGSEHIAEARAQKRIEAVLIAAGVDLPGGMIAAEAEARGLTPADLAALVLEKSAGFVAAEVARQAPDIAKDKGK